jgi:hypothetical protein
VANVSDAFGLLRVIAKNATRRTINFLLRWHVNRVLRGHVSQRGRTVIQLTATISFLNALLSDRKQAVVANWEPLLG